MIETDGKCQCPYNQEEVIVDGVKECKDKCTDTQERINGDCCDNDKVAYEGDAKVCCTDENKEVVEINNRKECKDKCGENQQRNTETGECEPISTDCPDGQEWNLATGKCDCVDEDKILYNGECIKRCTYDYVTPECCEAQGGEYVINNETHTAECCEKENG